MICVPIQEIAAGLECTREVFSATFFGHLAEFFAGVVLALAVMKQEERGLADGYLHAPKIPFEVRMCGVGPGSRPQMSGFHTGSEYVEAITALESDRRTRSAFQDLVLRIASPGAALFDFGAGPGIDARFYAERGFRVVAYDVDPGMYEYFEMHCREFMESGQVTLETGSYREFLTRKTGDEEGRVELVTSNLAPLNLIGDLDALFAKFHDLTAPNGKVLASVLSPYFIGDLKYGWWWRNSLRLWRDGHFSLEGAQAPIVRRRLADFAGRSAPYFALKRVFPGLPPAWARRGNGIAVSGGAGPAWLRLTACRFMFLLFEKRAR
jgi:SAM-dependent methyltransferase